MRQHLAAILCLCAGAGALHAQEEQGFKFTAKITNVRIGFREFNVRNSGEFKPGLWTPVYIDVQAGQKGIKRKKDAPAPYIEVEAPDSEGIGAVYRISVDDMEGEIIQPNGAKLAPELRTFVAYAKPGVSGGGEVKVTLHVENETISGGSPRGSGNPTRLNTMHFLAIGSEMRALKEGVLRFDGRQDIDFESANRLASFETDVRLLPDLWFGYQGIDMIFLSTEKREFLLGLLNDKERLKALSQWVRRGGKLVIPVAPDKQAVLERLLQAPTWQPPVPVVPPPGDLKRDAVEELPALTSWLGVNLKALRSAKPFPIARLDPGNVPTGAWDVLAKLDDKTSRPLVARMPYGLGQITLVALSFDAPPFTDWPDKGAFIKELISRFGPHLKPNIPEGRFGGKFEFQADLSSDLQREIEKVDVDVVPFGYVALFIILYILIVGPVDYFILKYVFKKLEWTWITFPTVVIAVSVAAYFTAYALKGNDLKVNKVDVIDFDLRTDLDGELKTRRAFVYGQSYLMLFSPLIKNYTVGLEVNPAFWGAEADKTPHSADMVTWLGRADEGGPGGMQQAGSQGFFRRPYSYAADAKGLIGVPIPVWTTRSFTAAWEATPAQLPFESDLRFHTRDEAGQDTVISGTLKSKLPVDLEDLYLIYASKAYPIKGVLAGTKAGGETLKITLAARGKSDFNDFLVDEGGPREQEFGGKGVGSFNPTKYIKRAMFFERSGDANARRNHTMRALDLSWRLDAAEQRQREGTRKDALREAVLYGRVRFKRGPSESITAADIAPTKLWLGALPGQTDARNNPVAWPGLSGTMGQDTYVRILLPLRAAE